MRRTNATVPFNRQRDILPAWTAEQNDDISSRQPRRHNVIGQRNSAPETLAPYVSIDVESVARDPMIGGDLNVVEADDGGVWVSEA